MSEISFHVLEVIEEEESCEDDSRSDVEASSAATGNIAEDGNDPGDFSRAEDLISAEDCSTSKDDNSAEASSSLKDGSSAEIGSSSKDTNVAEGGSSIEDVIISEAVSSSPSIIISEAGTEGQTISEIPSAEKRRKLVATEGPESEVTGRSILTTCPERLMIKIEVDYESSGMEGGQSASEEVTRGKLSPRKVAQRRRSMDLSDYSPGDQPSGSDYLLPDPSITCLSPMNIRSPDCGPQSPQPGPSTSGASTSCAHHTSEPFTLEDYIYSRPAPTPDHPLRQYGPSPRLSLCSNVPPPPPPPPLPPSPQTSPKSILVKDGTPPKGKKLTFKIPLTEETEIFTEHQLKLMRIPCPKHHVIFEETRPIDAIREGNPDGAKEANAENGGDSSPGQVPMENDEPTTAQVDQGMEMPVDQAETADDRDQTEEHPQTMEKQDGP